MSTGQHPENMINGTSDVATRMQYLSHRQRDMFLNSQTEVLELGKVFGHLPSDLSCESCSIYEDPTVWQPEQRNTWRIRAQQNFRERISTNNSISSYNSMEINKKSKPLTGRIRWLEDLRFLIQSFPSWNKFLPILNYNVHVTSSGSRCRQSLCVGVWVLVSGCLTWVGVWHGYVCLCVLWSEVGNGFPNSWFLCGVDPRQRPHSSSEHGVSRMSEELLSVWSKRW